MTLKINIKMLKIKDTKDTRFKDKTKRLVSESNISNLAKDSDLNTKLAKLSTKAELKAGQDKIIKLQTHGFQNICLSTNL